MPTQLDHDRHVPGSRRSPLRLILDDVTDPLNVGSMFRLADALGIAKIHLCGDTARPHDRRLTRAARSTEQYVDNDYHAHADQLVTDLINQDALIMALEITDEGIELGSGDFAHRLQNYMNSHGSEQSSSQALPCLILGAEVSGIRQALLDRAHFCVHIPMCGNNSSMNVATAAAIACYECNRHLPVRSE